MTDEQHNRYIAYSFFAHGGFQVFMMLFMGLIFYFFFRFPGRPGDPEPPMVFFGAFFALMFVIQSIFIAPSFIAGYALLKKKAWARVAAIVGAAMSVMNVPIGTGAAVYAFWFFMSENWKNVYPEQANVGDRPRRELQFNEEPAWQSDSESFRFDHSRTTPPDWR